MLAWVWGALLALVGNVLINLGANTLKLSHVYATGEAGLHAGSSKSLRVDCANSQRLQGTTSKGSSARTPAKNSASRVCVAVSDHTLDADDASSTSNHSGEHSERTPRPDASADRKSWRTVSARSDGSQGPRPVRACCHHRIIWALGFASFAIGSTVNFWAFSMAAQSLLAALGSVQFITNVVFSLLLLGEKATWRTAAATAAIVAGNVALIVCGSHTSRMYTAEELCDLYLQPAYIAYVALLVASITFLSVRLVSLFRQRTAVLESLQVTPVGEALEVPRAVLVDLPLAYAVQGAMIGTQSVTFAKSTSELLRLTLMGDSQLQTPVIYVILVLWIATMVFWIHRMNRALQLFPAQFIVPVLQVVWTLLSMLGGAMYFQEYRGLQWWNFVGIAAGVAAILLGVYLLAPVDAAQPHQQQLAALQSKDETTTQLPNSQPQQAAQERATTFPLMSLPMVQFTGERRAHPPRRTASGSNAPVHLPGTSCSETAADGLPRSRSSTPVAATTAPAPHDASQSFTRVDVAAVPSLGERPS